MGIFGVEVQTNLFPVAVIVIAHELLHAVPVWAYHRRLVGSFGFIGIAAYYEMSDDESPIWVSWLSTAAPYLVLALPVSVMNGPMTWQAMLSPDLAESFAATTVWLHVLGGIPDLLIALSEANVLMPSLWLYLVVTQVWPMLG